ncbi:hypothetical protein [Candidatus Methylobacter oryzae]
MQSVYADFYVRDEYWPDFSPQHFGQALAAGSKNRPERSGG